MYCTWTPLDYCVIACAEIPDEETCCANFECTWIDEDCEDNAI